MYYACVEDKTASFFVVFAQVGQVEVLSVLVAFPVVHD